MRTYDDFIADLVPKPPKPRTKLDVVNAEFERLKKVIQFDDMYDDIAFICLANNCDFANSNGTLIYKNNEWNPIFAFHLNINFLIEVVFNINLKKGRYKIVTGETNTIYINDSIQGHTCYRSELPTSYDNFKQQLQKMLVLYFKEYCEEMKEVVE